jgi:hypothetical protein
LPQVLIGGRNHAYIDPNRSCTSEPLEFLFLQDAQ